MKISFLDFQISQKLIGITWHALSPCLNESILAKELSLYSEMQYIKERRGKSIKVKLRYFITGEYKEGYWKRIEKGGKARIHSNVLDETKGDGC